MKPGLRGKTLLTIASAVLLYVGGLTFAWVHGTAKARIRTHGMLVAAEAGYESVINGELEAALMYAGRAIINELGQDPGGTSPQRMRELARLFNLDEINIVGKNGKVVASNVDAVMGVDFAGDSRTSQFLSLTNAATTSVFQPFRSGVHTPDSFNAYFGISLPGNEGIIQLGLSANRLRGHLYAYTEAEAKAMHRAWHFSEVGWYDRAPDGVVPGEVFRKWSDEDGFFVLGRYFKYLDFNYAALLPESYCYAQRNSSFAVTALVLAVMLAFFAYMIVRLSATSARLEAMHAAADARNAADLALAKTIQMSVLPSPDGAFMNDLRYSVEAESHPAREVGGDFYDFYDLPGGRVAFIVADVSGKGIPGAMFMMETKSIIKNCLVEYADVADAVSVANKRICGGNRAELFVTAWVGVLNPGNGEFEYVNAGHNRPVVRHADGTTERVAGKGGRFLGMFDDAKYKVNALRLSPGDVLCMYTDGITEAMNGRREMFGEKRLAESLSLGIAGLADAVRRFVDGTEQSDDLTAILFKWHGEPTVGNREFQCDAGALALVSDFIRGRLHDLESRVLARLLNASDEIVSNIVNYSGATSFRVSVEKGADRIRLVYSDNGRAYNPLSHVDPDIHASLDRRQEGGLGLVMVKHLVDRVSYSRDNSSNILSLIKRV